MEQEKPMVCTDKDFDRFYVALKLNLKTNRYECIYCKVTLQNVDISSDIIITETVDTSKYAVSISKKEENDKYSNPVQATSNENTAVMKQRIEAARGDVIELKITNENTQSIPETGVRLGTSRHVWLLLAISIVMVLFFWRRRKME